MARILVIDDQELVRFTIREILEPLGHQVILAENALDGLEKAGETGVDLLITDMVMPQPELEDLNSFIEEESGILAFGSLKKTFPAMKVLVISGKGASLLERAKQNGADEALSKPFTSDEFMDTVTHLLGQ